MLPCINKGVIPTQSKSTATHSFTWRLCPMTIVFGEVWSTTEYVGCLACLAPFATVLYYNFHRRNDKRLMRLCLSCGQLCQRSTCTKICMRSNRQLRPNADSNAAHRSCSHTGEQHTAFLSFNFVVLFVLCSHKMCRAPYLCISIVSVADSGKVNGFSYCAIDICVHASVRKRRWCCLSIFTFKMNREIRVSATSGIVYCLHTMIRKPILDWMIVTAQPIVILVLCVQLAI